MTTAEQKEMEEQVDNFLLEMEKKFDDPVGRRWALVQTLLHRAVHYATEKPGVEFCTLTTYMAEMIGHAHELAHGNDPKAAVHRNVVH